MGAMASQITSLTSVYSFVYSGADQSKHKKIRVTGLCVGIEFSAQMAGNAENVSIWWRHHEVVVSISYLSLATHGYGWCCTRKK